MLPDFQICIGVTLSSWEPRHIWNFAMFRILTYFGPDLNSEIYQTFKMEGLTILLQRPTFKVRNTPLCVKKC